MELRMHKFICLVLVSGQGRSVTGFEQLARMKLLHHLCRLRNLYYYCTKCGVDNANQMAWLYSVKSGARGWPVAVFYNIFNPVRINA